MFRSLVLFIHITGVLTMFAGLAVEAFGVESARRAAPRISGIAAGLTVSIATELVAEPSELVTMAE